MTHQAYPRSPKVLLGGIAHLGRFIDKIRMRNAGQIRDYNYITTGFDKHLVDFLGIDHRRLSSGCWPVEVMKNCLPGSWPMASHGRRKRSHNGTTFCCLLVRKTTRLASAFKGVSKTSPPNSAWPSVPSLLSPLGPM